MTQTFRWKVVWRAVGGRVVDTFSIVAATREEAEELAVERCSWTDRGTTFRPYQLDVVRKAVIDTEEPPTTAVA